MGYSLEEISDQLSNKNFNNSLLSNEREYIENEINFLTEKKNNIKKNIFLNKIASLTIVSKNYLSFALTLCKSFKDFHRESKFFVFVCDEDEDSQCSNAITKAGGIPVLIDEVNIPQFEIMKLRYSILELNTAVKPFALEYCLESYPEIEAITYIDPDIKIYGFLDKVWESLIIERDEVCLTPHLLSEISDKKLPSEISILQSGTYNLGFIGIRRSNFSNFLLGWWQERLFLDCTVDIPNGLFTDQKWIDLIPGFCSRVKILRDYSYNVAYWNFHERFITKIDNKFFVNSEPLKFFHFSGFNPKVRSISKHQNRFTFENRNDLIDIFNDYKESLINNGYDNSILLDYSFNKLEEKIPNNPIFRFIMQYETKNGRKFPSPLEELYEFSKYILEPKIINGNVLSLFQFSLFKLRPDVFEFFQIQINNLRSNPQKIISWLFNNGFKELGLSKWTLYLDKVKLTKYLEISVLEQILKNSKINSSDKFKKINSKIDFTSGLNEITSFLNFEKSQNDELVSDIISSVNKIIQLFLSRNDLLIYCSNFQNVEDLNKAIDWLKAENLQTIISYNDLLAFECVAKFLPNHLITLFEQSNIKKSSPISKYERSIKLNIFKSRSDKKLVNFTGQLFSVKGTGELARSLSRALESSNNYSTKYLPLRSTFDDLSLFPPKEISLKNNFYKNPDLSIISLNADLSLYGDTMTPNSFKSKDYKIGYWAWETENFPKKFVDSSKFYDKIWALSEYAKRSIERSVKNKQVSTIPCCLDLWMQKNYIQLASKEIKDLTKKFNKFFCIGYIFDFDSYGIRKNPEGILKVFEILSEKFSDILFVVKASRSSFGDFKYEKLKSRFMKLNCIFIEEKLSKPDIYFLLANLDCYLSMHRAEGFGLPIMEAMSVGTLAIATNYSGNLDFMNSENSLLIDTKPYFLENDFGPYEKGTYWRDPSIDDCVDKLSMVINSSIIKAKFSQKGLNYVNKNFRPENISTLIDKSLKL